MRPVIFRATFIALTVVGLSLAGLAQGTGRGGRGRGAAAAAAAPQTGGTAAPAAAPAAFPAAGRGGFGGRGGRGGFGPDQFFNYVTTAPEGIAIPDQPPVQSKHQITINGETLNYTAEVGFLPVRNATTGVSQAHLFYVYYSKDGVSDASSRPVLFIFGGGPGMAASWMEFGAFGPRRANLSAHLPAGANPYAWSDNPDTLLPQADLVFVNPVGTAYSRPDSPNLGPEFWTADGDVAANAAFIRTFLDRTDRLTSPRFLVGENNGSGRIAELSSYLTQHSVPVEGVILLGANLDADTTAGDETYLNVLPSEALAAWYHKKLGADLERMTPDQVAEQARQYVASTYLHQLYQGARMTPQENTQAIDDVTRFTGLAHDFVVDSDIRIPTDRFVTELLRPEQEVLSTSDTRVASFTPQGAAQAPGFDYAQASVENNFLISYEEYLRHELNFTENAVYYLSGGGVTDFTPPASTTNYLDDAFARDPQLRLYVGMAYYDLNTPFAASEWALGHLLVSSDVRTHGISTDYFQSGQMIYLDSTAANKLHSDLVKFITGPVD